MMRTETITGRATLNLMHGDCMSLMASKPDGFYGLAVVDPEYGININKKNSTGKKQSTKSAASSKSYGQKKWDSKPPPPEYFKELFRVSHNQIIWGVNYFDYPRLIGGRIFWDKCVSMPTYSDGELAYCSLINSVKMFKFAWHGMIQQNMKHKEARIHETQKPVALYAWILKNYAAPGDNILDTHGGSMSSVIAAWDAGLDIDCTELDADYYRDAVARVRRHTAQGQLF